MSAGLSRWTCMSIRPGSSVLPGRSMWRTSAPQRTGARIGDRGDPPVVADEDRRTVRHSGRSATSSIAVGGDDAFLRRDAGEASAQQRPVDRIQNARIISTPRMSRAFHIAARARRWIGAPRQRLIRGIRQQDATSAYGTPDQLGAAVWRPRRLSLTRSSWSNDRSNDWHDVRASVFSEGWSPGLRPQRASAI